MRIPGEPSAAPDAVTTASPTPAPPMRTARHWYHNMPAVLFITFCLEIGLFLVVFPWTGYWEGNYFSTFFPEWRRSWDNMYVRGGISGLGVVNLYIALGEIFQLRRFAKR